MLVYVAHEKLVPVFLGKNVGEVKASPAMSGLVSMIPDRLDVVVDKGLRFVCSVCGRRLPARYEKGEESRNRLRSPAPCR